LNWSSFGIGFGVIIFSVLIFVEVRRWQNNNDARNSMLLEILPPTGTPYYALAKKDEHALTIKSPTQKGVKFTYFTDVQAAWDFRYPSSDLSITQVNIKRVTYYEGQKEPALKRKVYVTEIRDGVTYKVLKDLEIATPTLVALAKDGNDLRDIIREVNGDSGIFGANTGLVTLIICGLVLILSGVAVYYIYQVIVPNIYSILNYVKAIAQYHGIQIQPIVPTTPIPGVK
jgi:hypothetical protein